jgi:hypothetical protein
MAKLRKGRRRDRRRPTARARIAPQERAVAEETA